MPLRDHIRPPLSQQRPIEAWLDVLQVGQTLPTMPLWDRAEKRGLLDEPGKGRNMGREAAANYTPVLSRCSEDVDALQERLAVWVGA